MCQILFGVLYTCSLISSCQPPYDSDAVTEESWWDSEQLRNACKALYLIKGRALKFELKQPDSGTGALTACECDSRWVWWVPWATYLLQKAAWNLSFFVLVILLGTALPLEAGGVFYVVGGCDVQGCGSGLHQGGAGAAGPHPEEAIPRCDGGELQEPGRSGWGRPPTLNITSLGCHLCVLRCSKLWTFGNGLLLLTKCFLIPGKTSIVFSGLSAQAKCYPFKSLVFNQGWFCS